MTAVVGDPAIGQDIRRRRWLRLLAALVIVSVAVLAAAWFLHWRSSLHELIPYPYDGRGVSLPIGQTVYFGSEANSPEVLKAHPSTGALTIHVDSITPVVKQNTADAVVTVLLCRLSDFGGVPDGDYRQQTQRECSSLTSFRSGTVRLGDEVGDDDLVIAITPRHFGKVRVSGVFLRYSDGLRHGTQHVGIQLATSTDT